MAHMMRKKGEFRRGFGKGSTRKIQGTKTKPGGREVLIPLARLLEAMKAAKRRRILERSPPREVRDLVKPIRRALAGAKERGINLEEEVGEPPSCPNSLVRQIVVGADRISKMRKGMLEGVIGREEAHELESAVILALPKLKGIERRICV
ncbi:MAG: hypothetical protein GY852_06980 [bacterium]|nr:hypothetical protein [bacterium]